MPFYIHIVVLLTLVSIIVYLIYRHRKIKSELKYLNSIINNIISKNQQTQLDTNNFTDAEILKTLDLLDSYELKVQENIIELEKISKVRSQFLGNVSHELRTPIFTIQGFLETLLDNEDLDSATRYNFLEKTHKNVLRLHNLLNDLIEISKIESKEMKMNFRYFNPVLALNQVIQELIPTAEYASINLTFKNNLPADTPILVLGDVEKIKQVVANLLENAIKYNSPKGSVILTLQENEKNILISVSDTGIGISEEEKGRIFERFYRVDKNRSKEVGGTGLGLAIVKHIIEAHGSTIEVSSQIGIGSTFSFSLQKLSK